MKRERFYPRDFSHMDIKPGQNCIMGVWNHLNGKRVFVLERAGDNLQVRITEDTEEVARFELPLAEVTIDNGSVALSDNLYARLKEFD